MTTPEPIHRPHADEVAAGDRFKFGANWARFLHVLDDERIAEAKRSLMAMLGGKDLRGKSFLDVGCGSGLFSLAARRLGASVRSFDFDPDSVACAAELKRRYFPDDDAWTVESGSVLDMDYLAALGVFDVAYSWGVLHHTGAMWQALRNVAPLVAPGGRLFIALYNDQGGTSNRWRWIKRLYCSGPVGRALVIAFFFPYFALVLAAADILRGKNPVRRYTEYRKQRGMSVIHDWIDWLGGLPFEVAKPEEIFYFYRERGFALSGLKTCGGGLGCNEFLFERVESR